MITDGQILHRQYLQSQTWKDIRKRALEYYGSICSACGSYGSDVHHLTYERAGGHELMTDLQVLCRECHETKHSIERATKTRKKGKRSPIRAISAYRYLTKSQIQFLISKFDLKNETNLFIACQRDNEIIKEMSRVLDTYIIKSKSMPELKPEKRKCKIKLHWSAFSNDGI